MTTPDSRFADAEEEEKNREYTEVLNAATLTELMEIADILGVTYQDHCSATQLKVFPREEPNDTDINKVIEKVYQETSLQLLLQMILATVENTVTMPKLKTKMPIYFLIRHNLDTAVTS